MNLQELIAEVRSAAWDNACETEGVVGAPDDTMYGCLIIRDSARSIIDSMQSEREWRNYNIAAPITSAQASALRQHFDTWYDKIKRAATSVQRAADAHVDVGSDRWVTSCNLHNAMIGSRTKKLAEAAAESPEDWCEDCRATTPT